MKLKHIFTTFFVLYLLFINISIVFAEPNSESQDVLMPPDLASEGIALMDAKTGIILYGKNMHKTYYPASITKVMTAILTIEEAQEDERVLFSKNAVFGIERNSSHISMDVDETLSISDALYAIMLASANEVCMALAEHISGNTEDFATLMTKRAKELGALNTNFANPNGLHDENHVTTPYDMAHITRKAVSYDKFTTLIQTKGYRIPPTERQPEERPLNNSHRMILPGQFFYEYAVGGKTGYTDEARHTLVTYAKKGTMELIAVVMNGGKNEPYTDTENLFEFGFQMYHLSHLFDKDSFSETKDIILSSDDVKIGEATIKAERSLTIQVPRAVTLETITSKVSLPDSLPDSVEVGDTVGNITLMYEDCVVEEVSLLVSKIDRLEVTSQEDNEAALDTDANDDMGSVKSSSFNLFPIVMLTILLVVSGILLSNPYRRQLLETKIKEFISYVTKRRV